MVGSHPNSPKSPHSAPASGGTGFTNLRNNPPENIHTLYGAVVGGPLQNDRYWDWRDDWVQNEIALDYNAAVPGIAAMQVSSPIPMRALSPEKELIQLVGKLFRRSILCQSTSWDLLHTFWSAMRCCSTLQRWLTRWCDRWYRSWGIGILGYSGGIDMVEEKKSEAINI